jgi:hypothetical protein
MNAMNLPNSLSRRAYFVLAFALLVTFGQGQTSKPAKTDAEIKRAIIAESIADYRASRGNCPCPYNVDRAGHQCGGRSAYNRPGGAAPICYEKDVTQKMVEDYSRTHQ